MARVKKTMKLIQEYIEHMDIRYDLCSNNVQDIVDNSADLFEAICNGFRFGYMQGMKAAMAEMKKGADSIDTGAVHHMAAGQDRK